MEGRRRSSLNLCRGGMFSTIFRMPETLDLCFHRKALEEAV